MNAGERSPDGGPVGRTEGARSLAAVDDSIGGVARTLGTSKSNVWGWRTGLKTPGRASRERLRDAFGIDPAAWDRLADATPRSAPADVVGPEVPGTTGRAVRERRWQARTASTLDDVLELLDLLEEDTRTPGLLPGELRQVRNVKIQVLTLRARLESGAFHRDDAAVWSHDAFRRSLAAIRGALELHPDALRAVDAALASAGVPDDVRSPVGARP